MELTFSVQEIQAACNFVSLVQHTETTRPGTGYELFVMVVYHRSLSILLAVLPGLQRVVEYQHLGAGVDLVLAQLACEVIGTVRRVQGALNRPLPEATP